MDSELNKMWAEAQRKFEENTNQKLSRGGPNKTLEDVMRQFESKKTGDDSNEVKTKARAKEIGHRVLMCIQLLGGIAAQGASIVSPRSLDNTSPQSTSQPDCRFSLSRL